MVDPDNEDRLLKIPPSVVAAIRAAALQQAREAVEALEPESYATGNAPYRMRGAALAAIDNLKGEQA
jgi:hypothetical protein